MTPFLKQVADDLYQRFEGDFSNTCLVFPNQRAILYFNKYLSEKITKPIWAPEYVTISELMQQLSALKKADDLYLLFELHKMYCKVRNTTEAFDNFYYWGEMMLGDFDDVDKYLVDSELLFQNLAALKDMNEQFAFLTDEQIEAIKTFWSHFDPTQKSELQKSFINIWSSLLGIYKGFKSELSQQGIGYEGMLYRQVAELIKSGKIAELPYKNIVFAGFNALNECEKQLFRYCKVSGKALFYWDYDTSYINNKVHEAGFFITENLAEFPSALDSQLFNNLSLKKNISAFAIPSNIGQAKAIESIITDLHTDNEQFEKTAILLPDENLLMPVLHSIPAKVKQLNITMGYPVRNSQVISLISNLYSLWANCREGADNSVNFYYKNVIQLLKQPYIVAILPGLADEINRNAINTNIFWVSSNSLNNNEFQKMLFCPVKQGVDYANRLLSVIHEIYKNIGKHGLADGFNPAIEKEILFTVYAAINRLKDILSQNSVNIETKTFHKILTKKLNGLTVPFQGEPLSGMQVMGFLESRTLDFENIIILSCNEGFLPKTSNMPSFVPYNLRKGFGMPTIEYRDAMYAYYFYRIIQRAANAVLVYNTSGNAMGNAEISRFATQLKYEHGNKITFKTQTFQVTATEEKEIIIEKTPEIMSRLEKYMAVDNQKHYLSPSALSAYIDCQLRFYFRYVAGIKEPEIPAEEIDPQMLGKLLHKTLQLVYLPFGNNKISKSVLLELSNNKAVIQQSILHAIQNEYLKGSKTPAITDLHGRNLIIFNILHKYVSKVIEIDSKYAPLKIIGMEHNVKQVVNFNIDEKKYTIAIGGNIDRIDQTNEGIRIVDYKTGKVENSFKEIIDLYNPEIEDVKREVFQTFLYASIYSSSENTIVPVIPSIYRIRDVFNADFNYHILQNKVPVTNINSLKNEFIDNLKVLISEIYNPKYPFSKTAVKEKCKYCGYVEICHRN